MLYINCGSMFDKEGFVKMLNELGYRAEVKSDGFIFEKRIFELKLINRPHWLNINWDWLKKDSEEI